MPEVAFVELPGVVEKQKSEKGIEARKKGEERDAQL